MPRNEITWETYEHAYREKTTDWYWLLGIGTVTLAVIAFITVDIIFAITVIIVGFVFAIYASKVPDLITVTISYRGIKINGRLYPYANIESFWISEKDDHTELLLKSNRTLGSLMSIPIVEEIDHELLREYLIEWIDEEELHEPLLVKIVERFM